MKKTLVALAIGITFAAPQAFAQSKYFSGLGLGLNFNAVRSTSEAVAPTLTGQGSDNDSNLSLQLQYNLAVNDLMVVGFGGTAGLGQLRAGTLQPTNVQIKTQDMYTLYVAPGYAFSNWLLGYGKLAYLSANGVSSTGTSAKFDGGYGLGLGVQALFGKNWYGQAEFMSNQYSDKSYPALSETDKLRSSVFSLGGGYKF